MTISGDYYDCIGNGFAECSNTLGKHDKSIKTIWCRWQIRVRLVSWLKLILLQMWSGYFGATAQGVHVPSPDRVVARMKRKKREKGDGREGKMTRKGDAWTTPRTLPSSENGLLIYLKCRAILVRYDDDGFVVWCGSNLCFLCFQSVIVVSLSESSHCCSLYAHCRVLSKQNIHLQPWKYTDSQRLPPTNNNSRAILLPWCVNPIKKKIIYRLRNMSLWCWNCLRLIFRKSLCWGVSQRS